LENLKDAGETTRENTNKRAGQAVKDLKVPINRALPLFE
jgi:hypothetical protein